MTGALAAIDIALWDLKGKVLGPAGLQAARRRVAHELALLRLDRRQCRADRGRDGARGRSARSARRSPRRSRSAGTATAPSRTSTSPATSPRRRPCASWWATTSRSASTPTTATRSAARSASGARWRSLAISGSRSRCSTMTSRHGRGRAAARHHRLGRRADLHAAGASSDLINAGVRMVQPDIVKMGGITGLMQCAALCFAHGVELVPHQTQPTIGQLANLHVLATIMHLTKPVEIRRPVGRGWTSASSRSAKPVDGRSRYRRRPGSAFEIDEAEIAQARSDEQADISGRNAC